MGKKKNQGTAIGRSIIKDRFGHGKRPKSDDTFLHTSELNDGYDWGRLNLQSVTEQSNLDEFLTTAQLAGTEFTAEKLNIKFVDPKRAPGLTDEERRQIEDAQAEHRKLLRIPRRPAWDESTTAEQLDLKERDAFLEWRRTLSGLQEVEHIVMTPYEKNLDFWRQLWRVVERSDVVVQIVDARNPLLFRCEDVESYVKEVDANKVNLLLINKADYLTAQQRQYWSDYFTSLNVRVVFWSALYEANRLKDEAKTVDSEMEAGVESEGNKEEHEDDGEDMECDRTEGVDTETDGHMDGQQMSQTDIEQSQTVCSQSRTESSQSQTDCSHSETRCSNMRTDSPEQKEEMPSDDSVKGDNSCGPVVKADNSCDADISDFNSSDIVSGPRLLEILGRLHTGEKYKGDVTTIGMIGYPNVGKSSTINAILQMKKVPVSATPGRTKHFQTLFVDPTLMLCDCPGLVFPSFVSTKADLVVNGVLPIDQMRDHIPPVSLVCERISRSTLESMYGIHIPLPEEWEDLDSTRPTAHELLNAYGLMRGYMTSNGLPDCPRSARYILKDYVTGKLLYCDPPPDVDPAVFSPTPAVNDKSNTIQEIEDFQLKPKQPVPTSLDKEFFAKTRVSAHSKGTQGVTGYVRSQGLRQVSASSSSSPSASQMSLNAKPWKKHGNKHKKEKLRRIHSDLDK